MFTLAFEGVVSSNNGAPLQFDTDDVIAVSDGVTGAQCAQFCLLSRVTCVGIIVTEELGCKFLSALGQPDGRATAEASRSYIRDVCAIHLFFKLTYYPRALDLPLQLQVAQLQVQLRLLPQLRPRLRLPQSLPVTGWYLRVSFPATTENPLPLMSICPRRHCLPHKFEPSSSARGFAVALSSVLPLSSRAPTQCAFF